MKIKLKEYEKIIHDNIDRDIPTVNKLYDFYKKGCLDVLEKNVT